MHLVVVPVACVDAAIGPGEPATSLHFVLSKIASVGRLVTPHVRSRAILLSSREVSVIRGAVRVLFLANTLKLPFDLVTFLSFGATFFRDPVWNLNFIRIGVFQYRLLHFFDHLQSTLR